MSDIRIGIGYDIHRLVEGRPLMLGGVNIPFDKGLLGYSDGDALLHAISDAMLGALSMGDIGKHFPDTDSRYEGSSSLDLLQSVAEMVGKDGWRVVNVDSNIIAERPKLMEYIPLMKKVISKKLSSSIAQISVKARTNEGLGDVGRGEAIIAEAVVLLERN